jgi:hypothetical protein
MDHIFNENIPNGIRNYIEKISLFCIILANRIDIDNDYILEYPDRQRRR